MYIKSVSQVDRFFVFRRLAGAGGLGIGQFWPFLTSWVVCFSSCWRDPQGLFRAALPTIYRQEHPHFMLLLHAKLKPALHLPGLGYCLCLYTDLLDCCLLTVYRLWIVDLELSSPFYSTVYCYYCYYTLKCGLFRDWALKFFQAWVLVQQWIRTTTQQDKGDSGPMLYRLRYAASLTYYTLVTFVTYPG